MTPESAVLDSAKFTFTQEANCLDGSNNIEQIEIECLSDIGIDNNGSCFYKIKTDGWSFDSLDELKVLFDRIEKSIKFKTELDNVENQLDKSKYINLLIDKGNLDDKKIKVPVNQEIYKFLTLDETSDNSNNNFKTNKNNETQTNRS